MVRQRLAQINQTRIKTLVEQHQQDCTFIEFDARAQFGILLQLLHELLVIMAVRGLVGLRLHRRELFAMPSSLSRHVVGDVLGLAGIATTCVFLLLLLQVLDFPVAASSLAPSCWVSLSNQNLVIMVGKVTTWSSTHSWRGGGGESTDHVGHLPTA